jgi:hypothetical protein
VPRDIPVEDASFCPPRTVTIPEGLAQVGSGGARHFAIVIALMVAVVGIVAAVALPGSDRIDRLLSGVEDGDGAIGLAQTYVAGESYEYGMAMKMKVAMDGGGNLPWEGRFSGNIEVGMAGLVRIDVLSVEPNGNGRLCLGFSGFETSFRAEAEGQQIAESGMDPLQGAGETSVTMTVDPYGKLIGTPEQDGPGLGQLGDLRQLFREGLDGAPRGKLAIGDTWKAPVSVTLDPNGRETVSVDAEYEIEGFLRYQGRSCIAISVEGSLSGDVERGFKVDGDLKGAMLIEAGTGCLVKSAMDAEVEMSMSSSAGSVSGTMILSVDVDLK